MSPTIKGPNWSDQEFELLVDDWLKIIEDDPSITSIKRVAKLISESEWVLSNPAPRTDRAIDEKMFRTTRFMSSFLAKDPSLTIDSYYELPSSDQKRLLKEFCDKVTFVPRHLYPKYEKAVTFNFKKPFPLSSSNIVKRAPPTKFKSKLVNQHEVDINKDDTSTSFVPDFDPKKVLEFINKANLDIKSLTEEDRRSLEYFSNMDPVKILELLNRDRIQIKTNSDEMNSSESIFSNIGINKLFEPAVMTSPSRSTTVSSKVSIMENTASLTKLDTSNQLQNTNDPNIQLKRSQPPNMENDFKTMGNFPLKKKTIPTNRGHSIKSVASTRSGIVGLPQPNLNTNKMVLTTTDFNAQLPDTNLDFLAMENLTSRLKGKFSNQANITQPDSVDLHQFAINPINKLKTTTTDINTNINTNISTQLPKTNSNFNAVENLASELNGKLCNQLNPIQTINPAKIDSVDLTQSVINLSNRVPLSSSTTSTQVPTAPKVSSLNSTVSHTSSQNLQSNSQPSNHKLQDTKRNSELRDILDEQRLLFKKDIDEQRKLFKQDLLELNRQNLKELNENFSSTMSLVLNKLQEIFEKNRQSNETNHS